MKLRYLEFSLIAAGIFAGTMLLAPGASAGSTEAVTNFTQSAVLDRNSSLSLSDEIDYDFGSVAPHDIIFSIPVSYHDDQGRDFRMSFHLTGAELDGKSISLAPAVSTEVARLSLPPGESAASSRHYTISYTLDPVVLRGVSADIFKLSVTGLGWAVPINQASLRLQTPVAPADNLTCFTGPQGSTTGSCTVSQSANVATVKSFAALQPGDSFNIFTDFPAGSYTNYLQPYEAHPTTLGRLLGITAAGTLLVVVLLIVVIRWVRRHRAIVAPAAPDYTNANDDSQDQAQRK